MKVNLFFFFSSGEPQGKDGNQKIRDKCKLYLDRVEELQEYLANKEVVEYIEYIDIIHIPFSAVRYTIRTVF